MLTKSVGYAFSLITRGVGKTDTLSLLPKIVSKGCFFNGFQNNQSQAISWQAPSYIFEHEILPKVQAQWQTRSKRHRVAKLKRARRKNGSKIIISNN